MNIKIVVTTIIFLFSSIMYPMNNNDFSVCKLIKALNPNGSRRTYEDVIKKIYAKNQTVCSCVTHLSDVKMENARELLKKEYGPERWEKIEALRKSKIELFNKRESDNPQIICKQGVSTQVCQQIGDEYKKQGFKQNLCIQIDDSKKSIAYARQTNSFKGKCSNKIGYNPSDFAQCSSEQQQGIILHELQHLKDLHSTQNRLLPYDVSGGARFRRSEEAAADRIPTACQSVGDSKCMMSYAQILYKENSERLIKNGDWNIRYRLMQWLLPAQYWRKNFKHNEKNLYLYGYHSLSLTRYEWAQRIYNLKLAEEKYLQSKKSTKI